MNYFISAVCLFVSSTHWSHFKGAANGVGQILSMGDMVFYETNSPKFLHIELAKYISFQISSAWNFIFFWCLLRAIVLEMPVLTNCPHSCAWCAPQPDHDTLSLWTDVCSGSWECWKSSYITGDVVDRKYIQQELSQMDFLTDLYPSNHSFSA